MDWVPTEEEKEPAGVAQTTTDVKDVTFTSSVSEQNNDDISTTTKVEKAEEDPVTQGYFLKKTISKFNDLPIDAKLAQGIVAVGYETPSGKFLFIYNLYFFVLVSWNTDIIF